MLIILNYMATSSAAIYTNTYIPEYVPDNLKWYERDGLNTWYKKNQCNEFLEDTDRYFCTAQIINVDIIRNQKQLPTNKLKQYQTVNYDTIKKYLLSEQARITSSIFRNIDRSDLHVMQTVVKNHFHKNNIPQKSVGCGRFLKICRDAIMESTGKKKIIYLTNLNLFSELIQKKYYKNFFLDKSLLF